MRLWLLNINKMLDKNTAQHIVKHQTVQICYNSAFVNAVSHTIGGSVMHIAHPGLYK